jgi:hypothetical protein
LFNNILPSLDVADANAISLVHANEAACILHAEACAAQRNNQMVVALVAFKIEMLKTRRKFEQAALDLGRSREVLTERRTAFPEPFLNADYCER